MPSIADQFADTLAAAGVKRIYGIVGDSLDGLGDAIPRQANQKPRVAETAIRASVGKRGVSVVVIPGDIALQQAVDAPPPKRGGLLPPQPVTVPAAAELDRLAAHLNGDSHVTILCGSGCAGAHGELLALVERLQAPMVPAMRGKEHVEWDKAIINGRADEILDLATTNLWR
jgi:thiamine pyrophosphate-dependent acetolactate synthase large subunit-like protein